MILRVFSDLSDSMSCGATQGLGVRALSSLYVFLQWLARLVQQGSFVFDIPDLRGYAGILPLDEQEHCNVPR